LGHGGNWAKEGKLLAICHLIVLAEILGKIIIFPLIAYCLFILAGQKKEPEKVECEGIDGHGHIGQNGHSKSGIGILPRFRTPKHHGEH
jgi:hypothetical protein